MTKRLKDEFSRMKYENQPLSFNFSSLILIFVCTFLLVISTFFQITFDYSFLYSLPFGSKQYFYVPQIPLVMFIAGLLGARMGAVTVLLYILSGMIFPFFALGGGLDYVLQPGFGYILSYVPAVVFSGMILAKSCNLLAVLKAAITCTLLIHICGLVYAFLVMMINHSFFDNVGEFIIMQSSIKFIVDFVFCIITVYVSCLSKRFLWLFIGK